LAAHHSQVLLRAPTRSRTFEIQRIAIANVQGFWFSTDNVLWIQRREDAVALISGLSGEQRVAIQRDLERYLLARGKLALWAPQEPSLRTGT
jgi:hypothetical protein